MNAAGAFLLFLASISEWFGREEPGVVENQRPYLILVEGNVGSGKSTTLDFLSDSSRRDDVEVVFEPVAEWQNVSGTDLLQKMFDKSSARRWNGVFQTYTSLTRYRNVLKPAEKRVRIMERSVFSEHACFLQNTMDMGVISDVEYCLQGRWFSFLTDKLWDKVKPDLIVYIRCDVDVLEERIRRRGRPEEAHMDPLFLVGLQRRHDDWLFYKNSTFAVPAPVVVLDGNLPKQEYLRYLERRAGEILPSARIME